MQKVEKTFWLTHESSISNLALNKDFNQIVIAGRNIFKIYSIEDDRFTEIVNLRVGKHLNLNFSCNDVAWNPVEDHWIATAATNGAVVLWNLNRVSRIKQETVFSDHRRTVNKVVFNSVEPYLLLSGSQDGTIKTFDIRTRNLVSTFFSNVESVRDVQFNPHQHTQFAAVSDNGCVQLWDLRKTEKPEKQFTAHSGPVFTCDWHPENRNVLATAGRDKTIKVWDVGSRPYVDKTVHTIASVGRIKWRPNRKYHIASVALIFDYAVNVWDIRRPYIPFATFNQHTDVTTGIEWRGDPDLFVSASKDCTLYNHAFKDATRPVELAASAVASITPRGGIILATKIHSSKGFRNPFTFSSVVKKSRRPSDDFVNSNVSVMNQYTPKSLSSDVFAKLAKNYILDGKPLLEICEENASLARTLGQYQIATVWQIVRSVLACKSGNYKRLDIVQREDINSLEPSLLQDTRHPRFGSGIEKRIDNALASDQNSQKGIGDEAETEQEDVDTVDGHHDILPGPPIGGNGAFLADGDLDPLSFNMADLTREGTAGYSPGEISGQYTGDFELPTEAFQPRHEIKDRSSPPPEQYIHKNFDLSGPAETKTVEIVDQTSDLLCLQETKEIFPWDGTSIVIDVIKKHVEEGDYQTAVVMFIVLGEKIKGLIEDTAAEEWVTGYLELLVKFQLWIPAACVVKKNPLPAIQSLSQRSTRYATSCARCRKLLLRTSWFCDSCRKITSLCSLCHLPVKGLHVWCRKCSHGGHIEHMKNWFKDFSVCPTGCGHKCELET